MIILEDGVLLCGKLAPHFLKYILKNIKIQVQ